MDPNQFPIADRVFNEKGRDHLLRGTGATFRTFFILFLLVLLAYSNTFRAAWHLDDYPSIVENQKIHITDLTPQSLYQSLQHPKKETLWRPLAHLSFAMNWFAGQDNVFGYHLINVLIHLFSACVLYLTISTLLRTPNLQSKYSTTSHFISSLATVLWMINPIQTQAVTYIVQRMTLLASFFFITGIYCYLISPFSGQQTSAYLNVCLLRGLFTAGYGRKRERGVAALDHYCD